MIGSIILGIVTFIKNAVASFFLSLIFPKKYFLTNKYNKYKPDGSLYLFASIILYLVYYTTTFYYYSEPQKIIEHFDYYTNPTNLIRIFFLTAPPFIYTNFFISFISKRLKPNFELNYRFFGQMLFANAIVIEAISYLLYFVFIRIIFYLDVAQWVYSIKDIYFKLLFEPLVNIAGNRYFTEFLTLAIFIYVYVALFRSNIKFRNYKIIILVIICVFSINIVNFFYQWEFKIFDPVNYIHNIAENSKVIKTPYIRGLHGTLYYKTRNSKGIRTYIFDCTIINDSIEISSNFLLFNPTDRRIYINTQNILSFSMYTDSLPFIKYSKFFDVNTKSNNIPRIINIEPGSSNIFQSLKKIRIESNLADSNKWHLTDGINATSEYIYYNDSGEELKSFDTIHLKCYFRN